MKRSSICNVSLLRSLVGCTMYMSMLHIQIYVWHTCQVLVSLQGRFSVGIGSVVVWSAMVKPTQLILYLYFMTNIQIRNIKIYSREICYLHVH